MCEPKESANEPYNWEDVSISQESFFRCGSMWKVCSDSKVILDKQKLKIEKSEGYQLEQAPKREESYLEHRWWD